MQRLTDDGMKALGGSTAVAEMMEAPVTTVHAFKRKISPSRLAHLKLAAREAGKVVDWDRVLEPAEGHDGSSSASLGNASPGKSGDITAAQVPA